jgi:transposase-like protein
VQTKFKERKENAMKIFYNKEEKNTRENEEQDVLELLAREGARQILSKALEKEVEEFLGRDRYVRAEEFRGYRNGYGKARDVAIGYGHVEVKVPRVSDVPKEVSEEGYNSQILKKYQRTSQSMQRHLVRLYLEGLSSGDFEPVFRGILGENAGLSSSTILKLKEDWQREYEDWKRSSFFGKYYAYIWIDGVYLKAGLEREKTALLCVIGVSEDGTKECDIHRRRIQGKHRFLVRGIKRSEEQRHEKSEIGCWRWSSWFLVSFTGRISRLCRAEMLEPQNHECDG